MFQCRCKFKTARGIALILHGYLVSGLLVKSAETLLALLSCKKCTVFWLMVVFVNWIYILDIRGYFLLQNKIKGIGQDFSSLGKRTWFKF